MANDVDDKSEYLYKTIWLKTRFKLNRTHESLQHLHKKQTGITEWRRMGRVWFELSVGWLGRSYRFGMTCAAMFIRCKCKVNVFNYIYICVVVCWYDFRSCFCFYFFWELDCWIFKEGGGGNELCWISLDYLGILISNSRGIRWVVLHRMDTLPESRWCHGECQHSPSI